MVQPSGWSPTRRLLLAAPVSPPLALPALLAGTCVSSRDPEDATATPSYSRSPCPATPPASPAARIDRVEPFDAGEDPNAAFARLKRVVADTPRTRIATATDEYLHARCRTRVGFVDDLEFLLCRRQGLIHVRSASRIYVAWDLGVNRRRVERLRRQFEGG